MSTWRWEATGPNGTPQIADILTDPWPGTPDQAAEMALAHLMLRAGDVRRVAGWRVRAWADGRGEAWVEADAWLPTANTTR